MGLSAAQARLLTITSRKSDCEFQSMRYSHEKIALSRDLTNVSNEYQNALEATKMVYDYYGTGEHTNPLSYNLLMTASELNGHMPMLTTTAAGRVVLDSRYAYAAKQAGIPAEGLSCLPSSSVRDKFYDSLVAAGLMNEVIAEECKSIEYSQDIGVGATDTIAISTKSVNLDEFLTSLDDTRIDLTSLRNKFNVCGTNNNNLSIKDIWNNDIFIYHISDDIDYRYDWNFCVIDNMKTIVDWEGWEQMFDAIDQSLDTGDLVMQAAISNARNYINSVIYTGYKNKDSLSAALVSDEASPRDTRDNHTENLGQYHPGKTDETTQTILNGFGQFTQYNYDNRQGVTTVTDNIKANAPKILGYVGYANTKGDYNDALGIDITNVLKAYLTSIYTYIEDVCQYRSSDNGGRTNFSVENDYMKCGGTDRNISDWNMVDEYANFKVVAAKGLNTNGTLQSGATDALFNQICLRGWTENNQVNDSEYLQEMYRSGKYFLTTCTDDGYYYQGDYSTNQFIVEVTDDEAIAKAEAKYNTEKQKINHKEEIIDLKMKNLDTEISSLTTEYDTVKSLISKNIEKGFKRYDA